MSTRIRFCPTGKFAYLRADNAHAKLKELLRSGDHSKHGHAPPKSVYHCGECGMYHLTSWTPLQVARLVAEGRWDHRNGPLIPLREFNARSNHGTPAGIRTRKGRARPTT